MNGRGRADASWLRQLIVVTLLAVVPKTGLYFAAKKSADSLQSQLRGVFVCMDHSPGTSKIVKCEGDK